MIQIAKPYFSESQSRAIMEGIKQILSSGQVILGPFAAGLERDFAAWVGATHAVSVNSCTTALQICLEYFEASGGEILVPAASFTTDVSVARWGGAKPVLVDIDPATLSFDLEDLKRKVNSRSKGVIWVHLTGLISPEYQELISFCKQRSLFVLEDCAHAQGAMIDGKRAGSLGDAGCFSFFATKLMTCGAGGMVTTNDERLNKFAREIRLFGRDPATGNVVREGNDWFLDEFRACIAAAQLTEIGAMLGRRGEIAERYNAALSNQLGIRLLDIPPNAQHAYYQYPVFLDSRLDAKEIGRVLGRKHGIQAKPIYKPVHHEQIFAEYDDGTLTKAVQVLGQSLCLPMHPSLNEDEVDLIAKALIGEIRSRL